MDNDLLTLLGRYHSLPEICVLLEKAEQMGLPLESGSWVEQITIAQLERLVNGSFDA